MYQKTYSFPEYSLKELKEKVLHLAYQSGSTFSYMDNNEYAIAPNRYELLVGIGIHKRMSYGDLKYNQGRWIFGQLDYEFDPHIASEDERHYCIFEPETVMYIRHGEQTLVVCSYQDCDTIEASLRGMPITTGVSYVPLSNHDNYTTWHSLLDKPTYEATVAKIKEDIFYGRYYELNYCIQYQMESVSIAPEQVFLKQQALNPSPFASYFRHESIHILSGSMERFVYKDDARIVSQPIKGTIRRSDDTHTDRSLRDTLYHDVKERAENVMIVDLTRNDLSRICTVGSIAVDELFGIYTFPFVHQMISTVSGKLLDSITFTHMLESMYPMGSMTGAPKLTVMNHIQRYEPVPRGIYSGTIFYLQPDGDWDSSVVIRTLIYDASSQRLYYHTGSAITYDSEPSLEWEELQVKAQAMRRIIE